MNSRKKTRILENKNKNMAFKTNMVIKVKKLLQMPNFICIDFSHGYDMKIINEKKKRACVILLSRKDWGAFLLGMGVLRNDKRKKWVLELNKIGKHCSRAFRKESNYNKMRTNDDALPNERENV